MGEENIETKAVAERRVEWTPKGYDFLSHITAIIRDGKIQDLPHPACYLVQADIDGYIEFLQVVKRAMAETAKLDS